MQKSFLPKLAFDTLKRAEIDYNEKGSFSNETLEILHTYFGDSLVQATELLEKCKIVQYSTPDTFRKIFKVTTSQDQHTVFDNINFCQCHFFKTKVLETRSSLTCEHVLAVSISRIMGKVRNETLTNDIYEEFLNEQLNICMDLDTQDINLS